MTSSVSALTSLISSLSTTAGASDDPKVTAAANLTLDLLLASEDVLTYLADNSSMYLPPSGIQIMSTVWGILNPEEAKQLTHKGFDRAILDQGGTYAGADALWKKLDPEGKKSELQPGDFLKNSYLMAAIQSRLEKLQETVAELRWQQSLLSEDNSTTILSSFVPRSGSVLDFFA